MSPIDVVITNVGETKDSWSSLQGILASTKMARNHTILQAIEIAREKEARRLMKKTQIDLKTVIEKLPKDLDSVLGEDA